MYQIALVRWIWLAGALGDIVQLAETTASNTVQSRFESEYPYHDNFHYTFFYSMFTVCFSKYIDNLEVAE
jgi:hypothetical protein